MNELTIPEVARQLGLNWRQVWDRVISGKIPGRQIAGRWLVEQSAIDAYRWREQQHAARSEAGTPA